MKSIFAADKGRTEVIAIVTTGGNQRSIWDTRRLGTGPIANAIISHNDDDNDNDDECMYSLLHVFVDVCA